MNQCGDCKYWKPYNESECMRELEEFGECQAIKFFWLDDDDVPMPSKHPQDHVATVIDGSGYAAALRTRESFGCVLWENRT